MRILVIGSGGREHALVWKIAQSKLAQKIFCAPGNGGITALAECVDIQAHDISGLLDFARREKIDLTVVGPEVPLVRGIADEFSRNGLRVFGPGQKAAQLEGSKVFAKYHMEKYGVPTAGFKVFSDPSSARSYIEKRGGPCVVKADGLAAGKGVVVAQSIEEAKQAVTMMMEDRVFGAAADSVIIEDCLVGDEASILVLTDSREVIPLASSQDHKRIFDCDTGPNTGGMGAYSPAPVVTAPLLKEVMEKIIFRTLDGLAKEGIPFRGVLYAGIMITKDGPNALEFNVRFGDPETQAILPRLESDLVEVLCAVSDGELKKIVKLGGLRWDTRPCVCVVCAAKGYPGEYEKNQVIDGLEEVGTLKDVVVFHAGTQLREKRIFSNGGRVLGVTGKGSTVKDAIDTTYSALEKIHFEGMQYRRDIGYKALCK